MLRPIPIGSMTDADLEPGRSGVGAAEAKEAKEDEGMPSDQITLEDGIHFVHWDGPKFVCFRRRIARTMEVLIYTFAVT